MPALPVCAPSLRSQFVGFVFFRLFRVLKSPAVSEPQIYLDDITMCRNIKTLFNFEPPATDEEIRAASLQFVRKLCGFTNPSKVNQAVFDRAVDDVTAAAHKLINSLVTTAIPRDREVENVRRRARAAARFGARSPAE
jgi:hypothetical protein